MINRVSPVTWAGTMAANEGRWSQFLYNYLADQDLLICSIGSIVNLMYIRCWYETKGKSAV